jgi:hypothetical protein
MKVAKHLLDYKVNFIVGTPRGPSSSLAWTHILSEQNKEKSKKLHK